MPVTNTGARRERGRAGLRRTDECSPDPAGARTQGIRKGHAGSRRNDRDRDRSAAPSFAYFDPGDPVFGELSANSLVPAGGGVVHREQAGWYVDAGTYRIWVGRSSASSRRWRTSRCPATSASIPDRAVSGLSETPSFVEAFHPAYSHCIPRRRRPAWPAVTSRPCPSPIRPFPAVPRPCRSSPPTLCSERRSTAPCPRATRSPSSALAVSGAPNVSTGSSRRAHDRSRLRRRLHPQPALRRGVHRQDRP